MAYQKPEKDFGEGPVRSPPPHPHQSTSNRLPFLAANISLSLLENPQDTNNAHIDQTALVGKSVPGAHRAGEVEGFARQGPGAATD